MNSPVSNLPEFSVGEISSALKRTVESAFPLVRVRGEIGGLKFHSSGHVYLDLKDDKAVLNAVIWRGVTHRIAIRPEQGMEVIATGKLTTYAGSSRYQMVIENLELAGQGALMAMLEARKKKLAAEGLFDAARKKPLPFLPRRIGVVTSPTGAVIRDIMHRLQDRFPRPVSLWPASVQGPNAAAEIAAGIEGLSRLTGELRPDVIIVARGGGSLEDLMPFNEEVVVRAAAACPIPLISAVGHETDITLIDFVADKRAPTPTGAAEIAVPVRTELRAQVLDLGRRLYSATTRGMSERQQALRQTARLLPSAEHLFAPSRQRLDVATDKLSGALKSNVESHRQALLRSAARLRPDGLRTRFGYAGERVQGLDARLSRALALRLKDARSRMEASGRLLETVSHRAVLARGFALVRGADGAVRRKAEEIKPGEVLHLTFADGTRDALADGHAKHTPRGVFKAKPEQGDLF